MRVHVSQVKVASLCASLLAALVPSLAGCGGASVFGDCDIAPFRASALTVVGGIVYGNSGGAVFAVRASDGKKLWQDSI